MKRESKTVPLGDRRETLPAPLHAVTTPIYTAYQLFLRFDGNAGPDFAREVEGPSYTRYGNPTVDALEELVRELDSGAFCAAAPPAWPRCIWLCWPR